MPKRYSSLQVERSLLKNGFWFVSQSGSHKKFTNGQRVVIVPANRSEMPLGTLASILRQSGLDRSDLS